MCDTTRCSIEECDFFDFMADFMGITVLHPGGLKATDELAKLCHIDSNTRVLDIACGKGMSSYYFAKKFGCKVVGIDINQEFVDQADNLAVKKKMISKLTFKVASAEDLPYSKNEFDVSIFQSVLPLVSDKERAIKEAVRVTKVDGYIGFLEVVWLKPPPKELFKKDIKEICAYLMENVRTYEDCRKLIFSNLDIEEVETKIYTWKLPDMKTMIRDEGISTAIKVILKCLFNHRIRDRMKAINAFFSRNTEYCGYGIYVGKKSKMKYKQVSGNSHSLNNLCFR